MGHPSFFLEVKRATASQSRDGAIYNYTMKAHVYVTLKRTVLDPQGQTIHGALKRMQYTAVEDVRQGKYFQLTLRAMETADARSEVERIAREVLTNPVIEEFTYRLEE